jgi:uncharacterized phage protein gp47/JayE
MPFSRPSLGDLRQRVADDLMNKLPGADTRLRVNNLRAFSEVEAGIAHLLYGRLEWSFRQLFPDTAEREFLDRWASIWGVARIPAAAAGGTATWQAQTGASISAGALMQRADGVRYVTADGGSEKDGLITIAIEAQTAGANGNADAGTPLQLLTTFAGVAVQGAVAEAGLAGGADEQSDALLLLAVLLRIQQPPHGGAAIDYVRWALEVPGVTRAWCYPVELGPGTVTVRFMMDDVRADRGGIPEEADVQLVAEYIDPLRPVTADVFVVAPIPFPVQVVIRDLEPDTPAIRQAIQANLAQMLLDEAEPGESIYLSQWSTAIGIASGVRHFVLDEPAEQTNPGLGEIATLESVTFTVTPP